MLEVQEPDSPIMEYLQQTSEGELAFEIQELPLLKMSSSRTIRSNKTAANNFREYLREKEIDDRFEEFDTETLNKTLGQFYLDARQADGTHYKVNSLENFRYGINRYLKSSPYFRKLDIIKDQEFLDANSFFKAAITELKRLGKGDVDHHPVITDVDLKTLYSSSHLDPNTPTGLLNKVQFDIRMYFFRRGMENMSKMTISMFKVMKDPETGLKIVVKVDESGNLKENDHENSTGIMPENLGSQMCPVKSFELYLSKVHPDCDRLWQRPREHFYHSDEIWYCRSAVGEKNLAKFMSNLSKICSLSQSYTNHSIRATGASILRNYFEPAQIMAVMGQKSALYLSGYQRITNKEKISMGQALTASLTVGSSLAFPSSLKSMCNPVEEMDTGTILVENQEQGSDMVPDPKTSADSQSLQNISHPEESSKLPSRNEQRTSLPSRNEQRASRFSWTNPMTPQTPSSQLSTNNEIKGPSENYGNKREASATVTSADLEEHRPSKILRRYFEGKSHKQRESRDDCVTIVESISPPPKERPKLSLPQTKVTFQPTPTPVPITQHRKMLVISEHQRNVMTSLASLWKKGQLCDAGIGNGTTIVMVHKIVLFAVCPKLLTMFNGGGQSNRFLQVNFPQAISHEALTAFAEYIYNGVLDLSAYLLGQLRQMALQLGMKELEMLCNAHLSPHDLASMTVKFNPSERPSSPYDSIQIVNFKTDDDFSPQVQQNISTQSRPSRKKTLSSNIYQRLVISSPEVNKHSLCLSPSLDESFHGINIPNSKYDGLCNIPSADIPDSCISSLGFESPAEKSISISNIKTEIINIDDDDDDDNSSSDQVEIYPHNAPTAAPADTLITNYSSLANQLQEQRFAGSTSRTSHKRKSQTTVNRIKYSSDDELNDIGWQGADLSIKREKDFDPLPHSDRNNLEADLEPFPVELISVVRSRKSSLKSAPD